MTLLKAIEIFIDNISVTDRQEENITNSISNLDSHLKDEKSDLNVKKTFTTGSWDRDTILRPLDDVDIFAVLDVDKWKDDNGNLPNPQSVLTKMKNYLNSITEYKDKVSQDRPCVTVKLSDKNFDILPSFESSYGGYLIPNHDLLSWITSDPEQLSAQLDSIHRLRNYKVKPSIKGVKSWNRDIDKLIPSYHIEEAAISIFQLYDFKNFEESIRIWFNQAEFYLHSSKFKSVDQYNTAIAKIKKVKDKLNDAKEKYDDGEETTAHQIWKDIFGKEFPAAENEEAKSFAKALSEGSLRVGATGMLSTLTGMTTAASKGFYGDDLLEKE